MADPTNTASDNANLFAQISQYLASMDLGGLFNYNNGVPSGWLWDQITSGVDDQAVIMTNLESTQQFQTRYGIINEIRGQAAQGQAVHVPTVAEVREYEQTTASSMRQAGLPSFMYDNYGDLQQLMRQGLSAVEVEQRLGESWSRVQNTDPEVRKSFASFFGVQGDAALASMYLDPSRTQASLDRMSRTAYTAGMGQRMGIGIDQATADRVAQLPKTDAGIYQDLTTLAGLSGSGVFTEGLGEAATDLTAENEGAQSVFFGDGAANQKIEQRVIERKAQNAAVPGGAVRTNQGITGTGTSKS